MTYSLNSRNSFPGELRMSSRRKTFCCCRRNSQRVPFTRIGKLFQISTCHHKTNTSRLQAMQVTTSFRRVIFPEAFSMGIGPMNRSRSWSGSPMILLNKLLFEYSSQLLFEIAIYLDDWTPVKVSSVMELSILTFYWIYLSTQRIVETKSDINILFIREVLL